jgi:hypothetical protein
MIPVPTPLNISCSCTECNAFLQPISHLTTPRPSNKENLTKQTKTKLEAWYSPLLTNESQKRPPIFISSNWNSHVHSPFRPQTPGHRRCTHAMCNEQITITYGISYRDALCQRHSEELRGSVKDMMESWAGEAERQARPMKWTMRKTSVDEVEKVKRRRGSIWDKKRLCKIWIV